MNPKQNPSNSPSNDGQDISLPPLNQATPTQPAAVQANAQAASTTPAQPAATPMATNDPGATPLIADDADLIEKEWVEKAKQLVDQTKDDPYKQNKEINKFKADYIKKRYNKDVQLNND